LEDPRHFSTLKALVEDFDPDLLALDSWISIAGPRLDDSKAAEVQAFIASRLRPLQVRPCGTRRDLLLAVHLRQKQAGPGSNSLQDRVAGSYYVLGGADACIGIEASGPEGFVCRPVKRSRTGSTFRPFAARIEGQGTEPLRLVKLGHLEATE